ncbi:MAG: EamA family transporter [bacterium]|nr:EamA family transporter [bacterium]
MRAWLGIGLSVLALVGWGLGDFFIQRTARLVGVWASLLLLSGIGTIVLLPAAAPALVAALAIPSQWQPLALSALIACISAPVNFLALRRGKISVVSPIIALELPLTVALSIAIGREQLSPLQIGLILAVFTGMMLASASTATRLERGAALAFFSAFGLAASNFLIGKNSQDISPMLALFVTYGALTVEASAALLLQRQFTTLFAQVRAHWRLILALGASDVTAWVAYALATTFIPIAVAITISESYVALAVLLGLLVNREQLRARQRAGVALAVGGVIILAAITGA